MMLTLEPNISVFAVWIYAALNCQIKTETRSTLSYVNNADVLKINPEVIWEVDNVSEGWRLSRANWLSLANANSIVVMLSS